ncbi:methyltransferase, FxLD system [Catellatospora coxensis]|uniref:Protein-L-isoaspartate O-methyltransferase n=1 Tax=Catellatospora coxensis TaxID=310354 RepID=A0A8J3PAP6_9ACTN|nr:methyltransferase, FxLD system [Catellatospora coxensis]GIG08051.1 O-methyltransferase [Catellatospora coxensis]
MHTTWRQHNIEFTDRASAEAVAIEHLAPTLRSAESDGHLHTWWFLRKNPFKLRYIPADPGTSIIGDLLNALTTDGLIIGWRNGIYEPETTAFGGPEGMDIAHTLFHHDSRHLLHQPGDGGLGRRETTVLLCSALLRAAGLDWYEQGDVWGRFAQERSDVDTSLPPEAAGRARLIRSMRKLMTTDVRALCAPDGALAGREEWIDAFEAAGQALAHHARHGRLQRGLRAVLAHHLIFHANRAGLPLPDQANLAALALNTVFADGEPAEPTRHEGRTMTTISDPHAYAKSPRELRDSLVERLRQRGALRSPEIEAAFQDVPRHLFVPGFPLEQAYGDNSVYTKTAQDGAQISAASEPGIVAMMLHQLDIRPGHRILEIGAGTGYNAALMGTLAGDSGHVTTIDVDTDLVDAAREHLAAAEAGNVEVVLGDGALGHEAGAPYDRIIATVGAWEIPSAWLDQLAANGRMVVPLRLAGAASRSIAFERNADRWTSHGSELAVFMPLRGIGDDARRTVALAEDVTLQVHKDQDVDASALAGVLSVPRREVWTGVTFPPMVSYEWMDLWLACTLPNAIMRMNVRPSATERGAVTPMFPWGSMATIRGTNLAYLTVRPATPESDGGRSYEVGAIGHGPAGEALASDVAEQVRVWDEQHRAKTVRFEIPDGAADAEPAAGRFVLHRPQHPIVVIWE